MADRAKPEGVKQINAKVTMDLWERLRIASTRRRVTMQSFVIVACERELERLEGEMVSREADRLAEAPAA